jgi:hypothetical protein
MDKRGIIGQLLVSTYTKITGVANVIDLGPRPDALVGFIAFPDFWRAFAPEIPSRFAGCIGALA